MSDYLLDTGILIDVLNGKRGRSAFLRELIEQKHTLVCCAVNIAEIHSGMRAGEEKKTAALLDALEYVGISREAAQLAGDFQSRYRKKGRTLTLPDMLLAAVAIVNDFIFVTDNHKDFLMVEIKLYTPRH